MYKGKRDPEIGIVIRQSMCDIYESKTDHTLWIEIFVPRSPQAPYPWGTIMVKPNQVDFIDDEFNLVRVNNFASIVNSTKEEGTHKILDSEKMTPYDIIGAILKFELESNKTAKQLFDDFMESGLTMYNYIQRFRPKKQTTQKTATPVASQPDIS